MLGKRCFTVSRDHIFKKTRIGNKGEQGGEGNGGARTRILEATRKNHGC